MIFSHNYIIIKHECLTFENDLKLTMNSAHAMRFIAQNTMSGVMSSMKDI